MNKLISSDIRFFFIDVHFTFFPHCLDLKVIRIHLPDFLMRTFSTKVLCCPDFVYTNDTMALSKVLNVRIIYKSVFG